MAGDPLPVCVKSDQIACNVLDTGFHACLQPVPVVAAEPVESGDVSLFGGILLKTVDVIQVHIEHIIALILHGDYLLFRRADTDLP